jgi:hypothetical protein
MSDPHPNPESRAFRLRSSKPLEPVEPRFRTCPNETLGSALYELRRAGSAKEAVAILDAVPTHLHGSLVEAAADRDLVASSVVAALVRRIGWTRLSAQCGPELALSIVRRHMPVEHEALFGRTQEKPS